MVNRRRRESNVHDVSREAEPGKSPGGLRPFQAAWNQRRLKHGQMARRIAELLAMCPPIEKEAFRLTLSANPHINESNTAGSSARKCTGRPSFIL